MLWSDGRDLIDKTVLQRRDRLEQIITPVSGIRVVRFVQNHGKDLFALAKEKGLEGIIAKRRTSVYRSGKRSSDWLKIKFKGNLLRDREIDTTMRVCDVRPESL